MNIVSITPSAINPQPCLLPLYDSKVQAGFPSPADDHITNSLDLNAYLLPHPASTFLVQVTGESMIDVGIRDGDKLIVDKSLEATNGKIVIAVVCGEFTVKKLKLDAEGVVYLMPANKDFAPIKLSEDSYVWGVVTHVIREV